MSNYRFICHSDKESKSKYKGGFIKGKNTSEYNHDYYIHNKEKWKEEGNKFFQKVSDTFTRVKRSINDIVKNQNGSSGHKYLHRIVTESNGKNKYRYFYTEPEWASYLNNLKKKTGEWSIEDDMDAVNPDYGDEGYTLNCASCSVAYDMRRRGYDVKAAKRFGTLASDVEKMYKGGKLQTFSPSKRSSKNTSKLYSELGKLGDGARGVVDVGWGKSGGRHMMNFEVINGQAYIIDSQSGTKYPKGYFERINDSIDWSGVQYMRTDNLELTDAIRDFGMFEERGKKDGSKGRN